MAEETIPKKSGAERQTEILVAVLERAGQNGGVFLNSSQKRVPHFYDKPMRITPANALIMAMHSDQGGFKTNGYTMYNETQNRSEEGSERCAICVDEPQSVCQQGQC